MSTIMSANVSESAVLNAYLRAGFFVSLPFGNGCPYDLIVDIGRRLLRIQVKTGWKYEGCLLYKCQRRVKDAKQNGMRRYAEGEVDFFAVHFPPDDVIFVVPYGDSGGYGRLRLTSPLNVQEKLIRWAADYSWDKHLAQLRRANGAA
jgi:hypothetical protein